MNRIVHFEIPSDSPEALVDFYKSAFGWTFAQWGQEQYWMAITGPEGEPGINGAIMKKQNAQQGITNTIAVENLDKMIETVKQHGGQIIVPKMPVPGVGWLAYFIDPSGNVSGMMQHDTEAK